MLQTESQLSDPDSLSVNTNAKKGSITSNRTDKMSENDDGNGKKTSAKSPSNANNCEWEDVKKARNRINSQRIRERERAQISNLEAERARLWLSNDAIQFQNRHFRDIIAQILEVREMKRSRQMVGGGMGIRGAGVSSASGTSNALAAQLGAAGALGGGSTMQMPLGMRHNTDMMGGLGGGLDATGLFQNSRLSAASVKGLSGLSGADLLARHQATTMEMKNMMRQQEAMDRFGASGGVGMGNLNMGLNNGMNINGINMNAASGSPYADIAENLRIRQLMLQQSTASGVGDFEPRGLLSSIGGGSNQLGNNADGMTGNGNSNGFSLGAGGVGGGDLGSGIGDADILQMSKRHKFGY